MEGEEEAVCWSESGGIKGKGEWERERERDILVHWRVLYGFTYPKDKYTIFLLLLSHKALTALVVSM